MVIDSMEDYIQILIEEGGLDEKNESDLEYFNFNFEFQNATEFSIYSLSSEPYDDDSTEWFDEGVQ
jgi:hypothetical protein